MHNLFQHDHYTFSFNRKFCAIAEAEYVRKSPADARLERVQMDWISNAHSLLMA